MAGHGEKKSRKWDSAIAALLTAPTIEAAATAVGVSERSVRNWLREPAFARQFREARRQLVETAIARLQSVSSQAVDALKRNLTCGAAGQEIRAALGILEHSIMAVETLDLVQQIEELQRDFEELKNGHRNSGARSSEATAGCEPTGPKDADPGAIAEGPEPGNDPGGDGAGPVAGCITPIDGSEDASVVHSPGGEIDSGGSHGIEGRIA
jgi:hypothetical protein